MADYREGLHLIPGHMHEGIAMWIERGEPNPEIMGSFQRAILSNDFMGACARADHINRVCLFDWADFLHNFAPSDCFGSPAKLLLWHAAHHAGPPAEPGTMSVVDRIETISVSPCRCGHTRSLHTSEPPHACLYSVTCDGDPCNCLAYQP